jgi:hypothetical protein
MILKDRIKELSVSSGLSDLVLDGAVVGYRPFSDVGDGNETLYVAMAVDGNGLPTGKWEHGKGIWNIGTSTLVRDTILSNSDGTADKISFDIGTLQVFCDVGNSSLVVIDPVTFVLSVGYANTFSGTGNYITIFGDNNTVLGDGSNLFCAGTSNSIGESADGTSESVVLGEGNTVLGGGSELLALGFGNSIDSGQPTSGSVVVGCSNTLLSGSSRLYIFGDSNNLDNDGTSDTTVIGYGNSISAGGSEIYLFGSGNHVGESLEYTQAFLVGNYNTAFGDGYSLFAFGENSNIDSSGFLNQIMVIGFGLTGQESGTISLGFSNPPELTVVQNSGIRLSTNSAPVAFVAGSTVLDSTNVASDLTFTSKVASASWPIRIKLHNTGGTNGLSVTVVDRDITVQLASTAGGITSTAAQIKSAIEGNAAANTLVSVIAEGAGGGVVDAFESFTTLSGAVDGTTAKAGTLRRADAELYFAIADILDTDDLTNWKRVQLI